MDSSSKQFKAQKSQYPILLEYVREFVSKYSDSKKILYDIEICLGEVFSNIETYGPDGSDTICDVDVSLSYDDDKIKIVFADNGVKYNPLEFVANTIAYNRSNKIVGGFGIMMVKKLMNDVSYKYENNLNVLTLVKNLKEEQ